MFNFELWNMKMKIVYITIKFFVFRIGNHKLYRIITKFHVSFRNVFMNSMNPKRINIPWNIFKKIFNILNFFVK